MTRRAHPHPAARLRSHRRRHPAHLELATTKPGQASKTPGQDKTSYRASRNFEHDYRELKTGLGLDHFEGRSFTGWHRHVILAALAQAFCTLLRTDPKAPSPG